MFEEQTGAAGRRVRFSANLENLDRAAASVTAFLSEALPGIGLFETKLLMREALLNAVIHGSRGDPERIVDFEATLSDGLLRLTVTDQGAGFDWRARGAADVSAEAESGRGMAIMRLYADRLEYSEKGERLTLYKVLTPSRESPGGADGELPMSEIRREMGRTVIRPERDIVASAVEGLRTEIKELLAGEAGPVAIDLSGVDMVDSVGIGLLIATHNTLSKSGRKLALKGVSPDLSGLFKTMRLDKHFEMLS